MGLLVDHQKIWLRSDSSCNHLCIVLSLLMSFSWVNCGPFEDSSYKFMLITSKSLWNFYEFSLERKISAKFMNIVEYWENIGESSMRLSQLYVPRWMEINWHIRVARSIDVCFVWVICIRKSCFQVRIFEWLAPPRLNCSKHSTLQWRCSRSSKG